MAQDFSDWIGRSTTRSDVASSRLLAEFRATLSPFLFERGEEEAPPGFHYVLAPPMPKQEDTGLDGAERKGIFLPPIDFPRRMWAGGVIESFRGLRQGSEVTRVSKLSDIRHKHGSSGELCLVSILHEISDAQGLAIRERQDLVFRGGRGTAAPAGPAQPLRADWTVEGSPLLLFRFSAITFNGHRIHYDLNHAAEEGYPGLLVQGPLQATLMLNLAAAKLGGVPERFEYRCLAPLYAGGRFGVSEDGGRLRILRGDGVTTAEGQAHARGTG